VNRLFSLAVGFVGLVLLANWLASRFVVHVPLTPYVAPAGVFCIGGVLVLRDWMQQLAGLRRTMPLVYAAGLVSWVAGDLAGWTSLEKIAIASVVAFTLSETVEALVFTPLRSRNLTLGVTLSATVGNALDSYVFLTLAFSSTAFFWGQFWGKNEAIALGVALTVARRRILPVRTLEPARA
jgi:queuosine precursor transporter